jgi:hypothetical protein
MPGADSPSDQPSPGELRASPHELEPGVDYLYCAACRHHVPCIRLQPGVWEVQCSHCVGACGLCSCQTTGVCHGKNGALVLTHMYVVEATPGSR